MSAVLASSSAFISLKEKKERILHFGDQFKDLGTNWPAVNLEHPYLPCSKYGTPTILSVSFGWWRRCWHGILTGPQVNGHDDIFSYLYSSSLVRRSSVIFVVGQQADFIRGLTSTPTDLSALLLEDGRFGVYERKNRFSFIFIHVVGFFFVFVLFFKKNPLGENNLNKFL